MFGLYVCVNVCGWLCVFVPSVAVPLRTYFRYFALWYKVNRKYWQKPAWTIDIRDDLSIYMYFLCVVQVRKLRLNSLNSISFIRLFIHSFVYVRFVCKLTHFAFIYENAQTSRNPICYCRLNWEAGAFARAMCTQFQFECAQRVRSNPWIYCYAPVNVWSHTQTTAAEYLLFWQSEKLKSA